MFKRENVSRKNYEQLSNSKMFNHNMLLSKYFFVAVSPLLKTKTITSTTYGK